MEKIKKILELVDGYKTYIAIFVGLVGVILWSVGVLNRETFEIWISICGLGTLAGFRSALK